MNNYLGYLIQPIAFLMVARLFMKIFGLLQKKLSVHAPVMKIAVEPAGVPNRLKNFKTDFAHFQFQEFDALNTHGGNSNLWQSVCLAYWEALKQSKWLQHLPAKWIKFQW
jgi:hypothetical protein